MKQARLLLAATLVVIGLVSIPITLSFGKDIITDAITRAKVNVCLRTFNACATQCSAQATSAPGSYSVCMQNCTTQYTHCMSGIARQAPASGASPRPSIAPPKPPPRKIAPSELNSVTAAKTEPASVLRPSRSPVTQPKLSPSRKSTVSPTPAPAKK